MALSRLSREAVRAIHDSLRGAQNWHAHQAHKAMAEKVPTAEKRAEATEDTSGRPADEPCAFLAHKRLAHDNWMGHAVHNAVCRHCRPDGWCDLALISQTPHVQGVFPYRRLP